MFEAEKLVLIEDAARVLETTELRVLIMLKNKELEGRLEDETWYVDKASLQLCGKPEAGVISRPGVCGGCGGCGGH